MRTYTAIEMAETVGEENIEQVNEWLARGDGIAVYENHALDSADIGHQRFMSFGSKQAQFVVPPQQLPDFGGEVNWRYQLAGVYRNKPLEPPSTHDFVSPLKVLELVTNTFHCESWCKPDRLVSYGMEVKKFDHGPSYVTITLDVTPKCGTRPIKVNDAAVGGTTITISTWTNDAGEIDRLAPFSWSITGNIEMTGGDPNLGGTIVAVYNNSLERDS